ncbi:MAG: 4a-hydroxytetrahydrobiopterin dehydratase [Patescibacteria group bacterium]
MFYIFCRYIVLYILKLINNFKNITDITILSPQEVEERLKELSGWNYANDKISKEFQFKDFLDSLNFVNQLAPFCEANDHHPDIHIYYSKILFELQRFDVGGKVTDKDFLVAKEIDRLHGQRQH